MNFLAHAYLSPDDEQVLVGNVCADFFKGASIARLPDKIREGVRLHRAIDCFADRHAAFRCSKRYIRSERRRYAPVILDVFFDHCLARNWDHYSMRALDDYAEHVCRHIDRWRPLLPMTGGRRLEQMVAARWLRLYRTEAGLRRVFAGLNRRARFTDALGDASDDLRAHYAPIERNFSALMHDLREHVQSIA